METQESIFIIGILGYGLLMIILVSSILGTV